MSQFGINARENGPSVYDRFQSKPSSSMAFTPAAGPSRVNVSSSIEEDTVVSAAETSVSFSPISSVLAIATRHPQPFQGFSSGYGGSSGSRSRFPDFLRCY